MIEKYLKSEEKIIVALRSLYSKYGYLPYKMNKFEEYDLYAKNKDFLVGDGIITFTDTNGKLLALKPDVTLSIIKNASDARGIKNKVYYNENVYRISGNTREFEEIMQMGLECIGDIDLYDMYETLCLAMKTLNTVSSDYVLEISHMGILSALLNSISANDNFKSEIAECIKKKSAHEISAICQKYGVDDEKAQMLSSFVGIYGSPKSVFERLDSFKANNELELAVNELKSLIKMLEGTEDFDNIRIDFSIVNDMNYYNGIVFNGFIKGIFESVLFGGRYDKLLEKMGKTSSGVGFAIYTNLLEKICFDKKEYDVDMLILYSDKSDLNKVQKAVDTFISEGKSVSAQKSIPKKLRYKELINMEAK
ncbi:MAG: ATP phosphoribosyltransferase regulatory subunit [Clostridia bacterium]|nr:ATP phosphoribosyltransferase regulatory subunit [Clostridia bacterium]